MKNNKNIFSFLTIFMLSFNLTFATWEVIQEETISLENTPIENTSVSSINNIDFVDTKTLSVELNSSQTNFSTESSEVKILQDLVITNTYINVDDTKKVSLELATDILDNTNYSLISVTEWMDNSIDFLYMSGTSIINNSLKIWENFIDYINIIDSKNIEIVFSKELSVENIEFKIFKELEIDNIFFDTINLNVKLVNDLLSNQNYIMVLFLMDELNNEIELENGLYEFTTPEFEITSTINEEDVSLDSASSGSWENIEEVAMEVTKTPDTWTKTNILLFLTFILTLSLILIRKKSFKL